MEDMLSETKFTKVLGDSPKVKVFSPILQRVLGWEERPSLGFGMILLH